MEEVVSSARVGGVLSGEDSAKDGQDDHGGEGKQGQLAVGNGYPWWRARRQGAKRG